MHSKGLGFILRAILETEFKKYNILTTPVSVTWLQNTGLTSAASEGGENSLGLVCATLYHPGSYTRQELTDDS